jgi:hypothetical protein
MTRIVIRKLEDSKKGSVAEKRLRNAEGKLVRVLSIDANSKTFDNDLTELFRKNVAKARRENKRLLGSASGTPTRR